MSSAAQHEANLKNAQSSTGPKTEEGKKRSSSNSTVHGFTGQYILVSSQEKTAYETYCIAYLEQYQPKTHEETDLIQQYADQQWTLHQISVQQMNVLSLLNITTARLTEDGIDFELLNKVTVDFYRQPNNLGIYEQRRRRTAAATMAAFKELTAQRQAKLEEAAQICTTLKAQRKPFSPQEFGFVHSLPEIEAFLRRAESRNSLSSPLAPK